MTTLSVSDLPRLGKQLKAVRDTMEDHQRRTLDGIAAVMWGRYQVAASTPSISARLRDLRRPRYGSRTVERRPDGTARGLYWYRLVDNSQTGTGDE